MTSKKTHKTKSTSTNTNYMQDYRHGCWLKIQMLGKYDRVNTEILWFDKESKTFHFMHTPGPDVTLPLKSIDEVVSAMITLVSSVTPTKIEVNVYRPMDTAFLTNPNAEMKPPEKKAWDDSFYEFAERFNKENLFKASLLREALTGLCNE